eukprot:1602193-Prymnesium_polylepis.1
MLLEGSSERLAGLEQADGWPALPSKQQRWCGKRFPRGLCAWYGGRWPMMRPGAVSGATRAL